MKYLNLSENALSREIPDLSTLTKLTALSLWDCELTGGISEAIYKLDKLQILDFHGNKLEGKISLKMQDLKAGNFLRFQRTLCPGLVTEMRRL